MLITWLSQNSNLYIPISNPPTQLKSSYFPSQKVQLFSFYSSFFSSLCPISTPKHSFHSLINMKQTTQNNWKKKPSPPQSHQQHQPKVMQLSTAAAAAASAAALPPPHPHNNKNIVCDQNRSKEEKKNNCLSEQELKLAAIAISLNVRLRTSDMPVSMQEHALRYTRSLIVAATSGATPQPHRLSPTLLARSLKKEFDRLYGPAWHCVVGKSFGSFVTHSPGGFVYFSLDSLSFLLFKTEVQLVIK